MPPTSPSWRRSSTKKCGRRRRSARRAIRLKVAVLAALNIADEYFRSGDEVSDSQAGFAHRAREIERMVDAALEAGQARLAAG